MSEPTGESDDQRGPTKEEIERVVRRLNTEYYSANPHMYFHQRLMHLIVVAAAPEKLVDLVGDGITLGDVTLGLNPGDAPVMSPLADEETREKYLATESTVLLHHIAEVLLRLELAHERQPLCPWIEMVNLRWDFKDKLRERFPEEGSHPDDTQLLFPVYFVGPSREETRFGDDSVEPDLDNISAFLHHFADMHLQEAAVYNSAKHGLGVVAGETRLSLEGCFDWTSMSVAGLDRTGSAISHLLVRSANVERDIQFAVMATNLMRQLWDVAKARYVGAELPRLNMFAQPTFKRVSLCRKEMTIDRLALPLWIFGAGVDNSSS